MKKNFLFPLTTLALALFLLSGCGGTGSSGPDNGGGGGGGGTPSGPATSAVVTLKADTNGSLPANTIITGYDVTISLPAGVTVKSTNPPLTDDGVVTAVGSAAGSAITAVYTPAAGSTPGQVRVLLASANGVNPGDFVSVTCDIAAGATPAETDFPQPSYSVSGYNTSTDSTVDLTANMAVSSSAVLE